MIPEALGNKGLITYEECDECNSKFGKTIEKDLQSFPGFQSLMKSRFKQFFAWPDLMNYAKNTSFPTKKNYVGYNEFNYPIWSSQYGLWRCFT